MYSRGGRCIFWKHGQFLFKISMWSKAKKVCSTKLPVASFQFMSVLPTPEYLKKSKVGKTEFISDCSSLPKKTKTSSKHNTQSYIYCTYYVYTSIFFCIIILHAWEKYKMYPHASIQKRNTKMFYWKKPYLVSSTVLFMKQIHCKTNGDLIFSSSVDLTEIPKFPLQFPGKIQFDHIRDLSCQTIPIYIVINFCAGHEDFIVFSI